MKAVVTGASSGIGKAMAFYLASFGYDLYVVSRNKKELIDIYKDLNVTVIPLEYDLSDSSNVVKLYDELKDKDIDILVNNAGFGDAGEFVSTSLDKELKMIDVNVRAYHILTKLFLKDFKKKNRGRILNVASMAGFMPGPYMATYYATKSYVVNLSLAIYEELVKDKSDVKISISCPGPVATNFSKRANVKFSVEEIDVDRAARIAIDGMFRNKLIIIPGNMKFAKFFIRFIPMKMLLFFSSGFQRKE